MSIVSGVVGISVDEFKNSAELASIVLAGALLIYIIYQWKAHHISFNELPIAEMMTPRRWGKYIAFSAYIKIVGMITLVFISSILLYLFKDQIGWLLELISDFEAVPMTPSQYILFFISICVLAPLWEELFFRGILLRRFMMKWKVSTSMIVSSIVFGLMHFGGSSMIHAAIFGFFMAYAYLKTKNIFVPIILHGVSNFLSFILLFLPTSTDETILMPDDNEIMQTLIFSSMVFVILIGIFIFIIVSNWYKVREIPKIKEPVVEQVTELNEENEIER